MNIINPIKTKLAICKALGIDAAKMTSVTIKLDSGMPRIEVVMPLFSEQADALVRVLTEHVLVEKSEQ